MKIRVMITGRSYDAAADFPEGMELPTDASVDDALQLLQQRLADRPLPPSCLVVHCGRHLGTAARHDTATLRDGDELMLIAPVAGG